MENTSSPKRSREAHATALGQEHFVPLSLRGFGDGWNAYIHGMIWFEGRLYCGTFRANLCLKRRQKVHGPQWPVWPIKCPDGDVFQELDLRGQIWRFDPRTASWENVQRSPIVKGRDGQDIPRECAYRGLVVFQGKSDSKAVLYVTPFSNTRSTGPVILRSENGETFEPVSKPGLGFDGISSFRFLTAFKGRVFTSPVGMTNNIVNYSPYPVVFESDDPRADSWRPVSTPGFGDPNNSVVFETVAFGDWLYAGTFNHVSGCQLWKTAAEGKGLYRWTKVLDLGAFRGNFNEGVLAMCPFKDALYTGTCIQDGGFDRVNRVGPAAGEIIRVYPDDSWDLVVGSARLTPQGLKVPTSGLRPGFDDFFNGYIWRMCVHEGRLYVGTMNWSAWLNYVDMNQWPERLREFIEARGIQQQIERGGGFDLWSTADGNHFEPVTCNGFGNPFNCGARSLVSTPYGLAVGTVNPFGPEVAVRNGDSWQYVENPRGGAEVWLGSTTLSDVIRGMAVLGTADGTPSGVEEYRKAAVPLSPATDQHSPIPVLDLDVTTLEERRLAIDVESVASSFMAEARDLFDLKAEGTEHIPKEGSVLLLGNNPAVPLLAAGSLIAAHVLYTLSTIKSSTGRPAWLLASAKYFDPPEHEQISRKLVLRLGIVPQTLTNGVHLLELGHAVLGYPETKPSRPPYEIRAFDPSYVRMAVIANAPIVPVVFIGTHESHLLIEQSQQILVNKRQPLITDYRMIFLAPIRPRDHRLSPEDVAGIEELSEDLRKKIQRLLSQRSKRRRLVEVARLLQTRFGSSVDAENVGPDVDGVSS
ncbi:MAG TPA: hypothetical protein VE422_28865 [Terriglobia bacterium]|nr:hypothetical protein [Terriglobia bacterium]